MRHMRLLHGMVTGFDGFATWTSIGIAILVQVCSRDADPLVNPKINIMLCMLLRIDLNHGMWILTLFDATITIDSIGDRLGRSPLESHKKVSIPSRLFHFPNNRSSADDISIPVPTSYSPDCGATPKYIPIIHRMLILARSFQGM